MSNDRVTSDKLTSHSSQWSASATSPRLRTTRCNFDEGRPWAWRCYRSYSPSDFAVRLLRHGCSRVVPPQMSHHRRVTAEEFAMSLYPLAGILRHNYSDNLVSVFYSCTVQVSTKLLKTNLFSFSLVSWISLTWHIYQEDTVKNRLLLIFGCVKYAQKVRYN